MQSNAMERDGQDSDGEGAPKKASSTSTPRRSASGSHCSSGQQAGTEQGAHTPCRYWEGIGWGAGQPTNCLSHQAGWVLHSQGSFACRCLQACGSRDTAVAVLQRVHRGGAAPATCAEQHSRHLACSAAFPTQGRHDRPSGLLHGAQQALVRCSPACARRRPAPPGAASHPCPRPAACCGTRPTRRMS